MDVFLSEFSNVIRVTAIGTGIIMLVGLFVFTIQKLIKRDLTDQTGWRNFSRPIIGVLFVSVTIQLIVIVFTALYVS